MRSQLDAAVDGIGALPKPCAVGGAGGHDLFGKFARRDQHQDTHAAGSCCGCRGGQLLQQGQGEGGGLAGAGRRRGQDIAAGQHGRNDLLLDRCRRRVTQGVERLQQRGGQAQFGKGHGGAIG